MPEPDKEVKDNDGWTWIKIDGLWSLKTRQNMPCYVGLKWSKLEKEYGPMHRIER